MKFLHRFQLYIQISNIILNGKHLVKYYQILCNTKNFFHLFLCTVTFQPHKLNNVLSEPSYCIHLNFQLQSARTLVPDTWTRVHTGLPVEIRAVSHTWSDKYQTTVIPKYTSMPLSLCLCVCRFQQLPSIFSSQLTIISFFSQSLFLRNINQFTVLHSGTPILREHISYRNYNFLFYQRIFNCRFNFFLLRKLLARILVCFFLFVCNLPVIEPSLIESYTQCRLPVQQRSLVLDILSHI